MRDHTLIHRTMLVGIVVIIAGYFASVAFSGEKASVTPAVPTAAITGSAAAEGAVEDTLQACLVRIRKDATAGQRMIAEQGCRKAEAERKPSQRFSGR
ncbi:MAG: hypothetical protein GDA67_02695 [Nitrospira sp. CR1.3]|nr:hypothetical protein [Nitrospira sp. CR1.3]